MHYKQLPEKKVFLASTRDLEPHFWYVLLVLLISGFMLDGSIILICA
jgi:hypothetical protein